MDRPDTIALFEFNGDFVSVDGSFQWQPGAEDGCRTFETGPSACDRVLSFGDCDGSWLTMPHDELWDAIRSVDFWFLLREAPNRTMGILSRDAAGTGLPGHFSLWLENDGRLVLRVQATSSSDAQVCSDAVLAIERWYHVEVLLGPPCIELWIDGAQQIIDGDGCETECRDYTIAGNQEPWALGADTRATGTGTAEGASDHLRAAQIDRLRFRSSRP